MTRLNEQFDPAVLEKQKSEQWLGLILSGLIALSVVPRLNNPRYDPSDPAEASVLIMNEPVDINHDPWWKLATLPYIGEETAKRIVSHREESDQHPPFRTLDDLRKVQGIGRGTLWRIRQSNRAYAGLMDQEPRSSVPTGVTSSE